MHLVPSGLGWPDGRSAQSTSRLTPSGTPVGGKRRRLPAKFEAKYCEERDAQLAAVWLKKIASAKPGARHGLRGIRGNSCFCYHGNLRLTA